MPFSMPADIKFSTQVEHWNKEDQVFDTQRK